MAGDIDMENNNIDSVGVLNWDNGSSIHNALEGLTIDGIGTIIFEIASGGIGAFHSLGLTLAGYIEMQNNNIAFTTGKIQMGAGNSEIYNDGENLIINETIGNINIKVPTTKLVIIDEQTAINELGGYMRRYNNGTGAPSIKGTVVKADPNDDDSIEVIEADGLNPIGVIYESDIEDGNPVWVVTENAAETLIEDGTAAVHGNFAKVSDIDAGRADMTNGSPPNVNEHFQELGHCLESQGSGTGVLVLCQLHFN